MVAETKSKVHLRFALISFAIVALFAGGFVFLAREVVRIHGETQAARTTSMLVGAPLRHLLDGSSEAAPSQAELRARAGAGAGRFVAGDVLAIRIWWAQDEEVFATGDRTLANGAPAAGVRFARTRLNNGAPIFAAYVDGNGYIIEIDRDAAAIDPAIIELQNILTGLAALFAAAFFALLQGGFLFSIRRFVRDHHRLQFLYTTGQEIRSSLDLHEVLAQIAREGARLANAQYGLVALYDSGTGDLMLRSTYDHATGATAAHQRAIEEWFLRRCIATNTTIVSTQPAPAYRQLFGPEMILEGQVSLLCVPMSLRDRVIGAVTMVRPAGPHAGYAPGEIRTVEELANQAVMAVEQALLFQKVRSYADELELSYDTTLKVLMAALDTKDDVTEGHCERVARLTSQLARAMKVPEAALIDMERGALLHDVGKIGVPDAVLRKPKDLNEMEWEAMRKHPLLAGLLVSKVGFLEGALPILLYHHERFDGTGYPFRLEGDKIPLDARIFSVVDSYDAMTSDRPYRKAMSHEEAMEEIRENSGTQFDPEVVEVFDELMGSRPDLHARPHAISDEHIDHDEPEADGAPADEEHAA